MLGLPPSRRTGEGTHIASSASTTCRPSWRRVLRSGGTGGACSSAALVRCVVGTATLPPSPILPTGLSAINTPTTLPTLLVVMHRKTWPSYPLFRLHNQLYYSPRFTPQLPLTLPPRPGDAPPEHETSKVITWASFITGWVSGYPQEEGFWGGFVGHIETGEGRSIGADLTDLLLLVVRVEDRGLSRDSGEYGASQEDMERHKAAGLCVSGSEKGHEHRNAKHAVRGPGAFSALPRWANAAPAVYREVTKAGRGF